MADPPEEKEPACNCKYSATNIVIYLYSLCVPVWVTIAKMNLRGLIVLGFLIETASFLLRFAPGWHSSAD